MQKDVLVLGAGPAGSAAAIAMCARGLSVVLCDRSPEPESAFGENMPPHMRAQLAELEVWDRFLESRPQPSYSLHSCWGNSEPFETCFFFNPYGQNAWHVERRELDRMLTDAAVHRGAALLRAARLRWVERKRGGWHLDFDLRPPGGEPGIEHLDVRFVVDASGRASSFGRRMGPRLQSLDALVGMVGVFGNDSLPPESPLLLEAVADGWWYSLAMPDAKFTVAFITDLDLLRRAGGSQPVWKGALEQAPLTRCRVKALRARSSPSTRSARTVRLSMFSGEGWLAAGDAAFAVDPLSGTGVARALHQGMAAAQAVEAALDGKPEAVLDYSTSLERQYSRHLVQRTTYYAREQRWPGSVFWQRRHRAA